MPYDTILAFEAIPRKRCCQCRERKHPCNFQRDRSRPDGLSRRCRRCDRAKSTRYNADKRTAMATLALFAEAL